MDQEEILKACSGMVLRIAFTNVKNMTDAEDIAQEVLISLMTKGPRFESEEHRKAWLIRATANRCKNYRKSFWFRRAEPPADIPGEVPEEDSGVLAAVLALPRNYRNAVYLHYYEGYQIREIAVMLKKKPATVGTWLSRGRQALKAALEGGFDDDE